MTQDNANNFDNANNANYTNNANSFNNANNANNADEWLMMLMNNAWVKQEPHDRSVLLSSKGLLENNGAVGWGSQNL